MPMRGRSFTGCAGWSLPRQSQHRFAAEGSHLARYASVLGCTEINSSFHRPHTRATYERWAASVPEGFRFCAKLPKAITHERKLAGCEALLDDFLAQAAGLGPRLACLLVQLPPSLAFDAPAAASFFKALRARWAGTVAAEPRHATWFEDEADGLLAGLGIARVLADPVRHAAGARPGGSRSVTYLRLHGSPRMYYSSYEPAVIEATARRIAMELADGRDTWCIFDNTAGGAAVDNALALEHLLGKESG